MQLPSGTVTLLMTDVEGSTQLWERYPHAMPAALERHDALAAACVEKYHGSLVKERGEGDSLFLVFSRATDALACACALQKALQDEPWSQYTTNAPDHDSNSPLAISVRMAIHTGETLRRDDDYYGATVNRCARIRAAAFGGQLVVSQAAYNLIGENVPPGVSFLDLGWHRLKDLRQPERLFQAVAPDWRTDFPPLNSLEIYRHNLPLQLTSFLGREDELAEVRRRLDTGRLVTLIGSGGCGKTRLALQAATELIGQYPDGVWNVELAALFDPERIPNSIAKALRLSEVAGKPLLTTIVEYLAAKRTLLILDNCEHLRYDCAQIARHLLKSCAYLSILATSRARLGVAGESFWTIPSFAVPTEGGSLSDAMRYTSIQLFAERAKEVHSSFDLTPANLSPVVQICRRLDGIPLAIEMAAARVSVLTPEQINARLNRRFRLLTNNDTTILERHQTLQTLIDWSYDLLSKQERRLLCYFSVFAGGWTLEAAEAVCSDTEYTTDVDAHDVSAPRNNGSPPIAADDVLDLLTNLVVNASLVTVEDMGTVRRYSLLETVRQYAVEKLEQTGQAPLLRARHLRYFAELAAEAEPHLSKPDQKVWLDRLDTENNNLRAALSWSVGIEDRLRLAGSLWRFWYMRGRLSEGRAWLDGSLARSQTAPVPLRAKALYAAGVLARQQGDYAAAESLLERSLKLYQDLNDRSGCGSVLLSLGLICRDKGDHESARYYYKESLARYEEIGDPIQIATALNNLGGIEVSMSHYQEGKALFERSLEMFQEHGHRHGIGFTLHNLGETHLLMEEHPRALMFFTESLQIRQSLGDSNTIALTLGALGKAVKGVGYYDRAVILFGAAQALRESTGAPLPPSDREAYERHVEDARVILGEDLFTVSWTRGQTATLDDIVRVAMMD